MGCTSSKINGSHTVLGSSASSPSSGPESRADPRAAAAEAAERRRQDAQNRGTHASNPNQGALAAKVEANKNAKRIPEPRQEERIVWD